MRNSDTQHHPRRILSSGFTLAVIIGGTIGLGILRTPGEVAEVVTDPLMFVSLWVLGGLFALLTAIVVAELMGMTPRSGGTYALVRRAYGPFPGFVIGWVDWLSFVADIALKAVVITEFVTLLIPATEQLQTPLAIIVSSVFAALQLRSVTLGAKIQEIAAILIALIIVGFTLVLVFAESAVSSSSEKAGLDAVKEVGHGHDFLMHPHTLKYLRGELSSWEREKLDLLEMDEQELPAEANKIVKSILDKHRVEPIANDLIEKGDVIITKYEDKVGD